jgi:hypothetical protein
MSSRVCAIDEELFIRKKMIMIYLTTSFTTYIIMRTKHVLTSFFLLHRSAVCCTGTAVGTELEFGCFGFVFRLEDCVRIVGLSGGTMTLGRSREC